MKIVLFDFDKLVKKTRNLIKEFLSPIISAQKDPFRMNEMENELPELIPELEIKEEPDVSEGSDDAEHNTYVTERIHVKDRIVYDWEPKMGSLASSDWPHHWLKRVEANYKLRLPEAKKNAKLLQALLQLFEEAKRVSLVKNFLLRHFSNDQY